VGHFHRNVEGGWKAKEAARSCREEALHEAKEIRDSAIAEAAEILAEA
jgi:F0F1-type ATP synthase membrane subunit b/b'